MKQGTALLALICGLLCASIAHAAPVLVISLDGLRASDSTAMPTLAKLRQEGTYAEQVTGTWPTLTYPAHTTLVTGASPARHGIAGNEAFDPLGTNQAGWMWYAEDIKADTLWAAAGRAGMTSAAINWPATVGAAITWNLPQIWHTRGAEDAKLQRALATPSLEPALTAMVGSPYPLGSDGTCEADSIRAKYAAALIDTKRPDLTLLHLECLDHAEHDFGPGSAQARTAMARLDATVDALIRSASHAQSGLVVVIVSDHGFVQVKTVINLHAAFRDAGLVHTDRDGTPVEWTAQAWQMGGIAAVVLKNPGDPKAHSRVSAILERLRQNSRLGISEIREGSPEGSQRASFWIIFKPGFSSGGYASGPVIQASEIQGTHGYPPNLPEMKATFFMVGPQISAGLNLQMIDMRAIAPTIARMLGVKLQDEEIPPLDMTRGLRLDVPPPK